MPCRPTPPPGGGPECGAVPLSSPGERLPCSHSEGRGGRGHVVGEDQLDPVGVLGVAPVDRLVRVVPPPCDRPRSERGQGAWEWGGAPRGWAVMPARGQSARRRLRGRAPRRTSRCRPATSGAIRRLRRCRRSGGAECRRPAPGSCAVPCSRRCGGATRLRRGRFRGGGGDDPYSAGPVGGSVAVTVRTSVPDALPVVLGCPVRGGERAAGLFCALLPGPASCAGGSREGGGGAGTGR